MQLGLVTYMWGAEWDLPTVIKNCQLTGFRGVELRTMHKHGVEPSLSAAERRDVAKRFADGGVDLVGLGTTCEFHSPDPAVVKKNIDQTKDFIKLCHDCGGTGVKVRPNGLPKDVPVKQTLEQIGRSLAEAAAFGEGYGVTIRLEVHGRGTDELPNVKTIMDAATHPGAVVCWNCNATDMAGQGLVHNFNLVKDRLGTIHIHDLISSYPWQQLFDLLNEAGFQGWTLVEEGDKTADPIRVMTYYRLLWERMTRTAGSGK
ncbi:MAG: sugar phosphate isomerase/epimerase [Planctomycetia bacterium]|nr:sugar phosphate isomerase/epimerase [Planctomycetia bacterium]